MQHRAKDFAGHVGDPVHTDHGGRDKGACAWALQRVDQTTLSLGLCDVVGDGFMGCGVDDGADVCGQKPWIGHHEFVHRTFEHFDQLFGDIFLHVKATECRAALTRRAERAVHNVAHGVLGQGGAVDDHGVQATCLGNKRCACGAVCCHGLADFERGCGGACESHATYPRVRGECCANSATTGDELQG